MSEHSKAGEQQKQTGGGSSGKGKPAAPPAEVWEFKCAAEASALLNCVANEGRRQGYNEIKCQNLLKALRACCEKEVRPNCMKIARPLTDM